MERRQRAFTKDDTVFKQLFGVKKETFHEMLAVLAAAYEVRRHKGGPRPKLTTGDQLFLTLQYWREYRTMEHLAYEFALAKSTVSDTMTRVENVLVQDGSFRLPGKKALLSPENAGRTFAVDVTESPIERPKKNKKPGTPGRKNDIR